MKPEVIQENNELIARYKGWKLIQPPQGMLENLYEKPIWVCKEFKEEYPVDGHIPYDDNSDTGFWQYFYPQQETLNFHNSWEDLMRLVVEINEFRYSVRPFVFGKPESVKLKILEDKVTLSGCFWTNPSTTSGNHWSFLRKTFKYSKYSQKEAVWLAVVEFIKWYNKNLNI